MTTHSSRMSDGSAMSRAAAALRDSVLLKVATAGILFILVAVGIELAIQAGFLVRGLSGTIAVLVLLWGVGMLVVGTVGRTLIWWRRR